MTALGIAAGVSALISLCALSYWIGRMVQAAADFDALVSMIRFEPADEIEQESNHYGV